MKERRNGKVTKGLLIIYGLCAVIWTALTIMKLAGGTTAVDLALTAFCAVIWTGLLIRYVLLYRKQRSKEEENGNGKV